MLQNESKLPNRLVEFTGRIIVPSTLDMDSDFYIKNIEHNVIHIKSSVESTDNDYYFVASSDENKHLLTFGNGKIHYKLSKGVNYIATKFDTKRINCDTADERSVTLLILEIPHDKHNRSENNENVLSKGIMLQFEHIEKQLLSLKQRGFIMDKDIVNICISIGSKAFSLANKHCN